MTACSTAAQAAVVPGRALPPCRSGVEFDAEPDQVLQRVDVDVAGHDRAPSPRRRRWPRRRPRPATRRRWRRSRRRTRGARPTAPAPAPSIPLAGAESPSSSIRSASEMCAQALTGCPARSGSSPAAVSRRIASASASWYRCPLVRSSSFPAGADSASSTAADRGGAPGGQVPVQDPGPADRGGQLHLPVRELPPRVLIRQVPPGPHVHLGEQAGQVGQPQPPGERGQQLLVRRVPVLVRQLVGPQADQPPGGLRDLPGGQRGQHPRMRGRPLGPRAVPDGGAAGDPGAVDQPGHRAVVPVPGGSLPGGERGQEPGPRRGQGRGVLFEFAQALGLGRGGELGGVGGGQVPQPGADHVECLTGICRGRISPGSPPRRDWSPLRAVLYRPREGQASRI